jgi:hypothetical protein
MFLAGKEGDNRHLDFMTYAANPDSLCRSHRATTVAKRLAAAERRPNGESRLKLNSRLHATKRTSVVPSKAALRVVLGRPTEVGR